MTNTFKFTIRKSPKALGASGLVLALCFSFADFGISWFTTLAQAKGSKAEGSQLNEKSSDPSTMDFSGRKIAQSLSDAGDLSLVQTWSFSPAETDPAIKQMGGPEFAYWNSEISNGKLMITIAGTSSRPEDLARQGRIAASLGYQVISIDYSNAISTVECNKETKKKIDALCYEKFHDEVVFGKAVSSLVKVDPANSIQNRIEKTLAFLSKAENKKPGANWLRFYLPNGKLNWAKATLVGHSQGTGHAAYISKFFSVDKVIIIGGLQDHFAADKPASWVTLAGATAAKRYFALIHRDDFYNKKDAQLKTFKAIADDENVEERIIYSIRPMRDAHMDIISETYLPEFANLLKAQP